MLFAIIDAHGYVTMIPGLCLWFYFVQICSILIGSGPDVYCHRGVTRQMVGKILRDSGWTNILSQAQVLTTGRAQSALNENNINKANLRDLIAATGLVISNWIQIVNFSACVTVKFDGWPCKTIGHLFYATSSFVHHFVPIGEFKLKLQSGNAQSGSN